MGNNLDLNHIERIDAFEKGTLTPEEVLSFQEDLKSDKELNKHFNYIQQLKAALQQERKQKLIGQFKDWDQSTISTPQNDNASRIIQLNPRRKWVAIAASFLFFSLAGWWLLSSSSPDNHLALVDQYFSPYPALTVKRSNGEEKGIVLYNAKQYELAEDFLKTSQDPDALFYLANTYLALNESQEAILALKEYRGEKFKSITNWYLALSYLQDSQIEEARNLLEQLAAASGDYSQKAAEVLQALAK